MSSLEKVSIIVPIYNVEKYLSRCINSLLSQTYNNLEIILVNDGSTDGSLKICKQYISEYENIILIDKKNGGLSSARNAGLDIFSGEYVSFLDSDDWVAKDYVEILMRNLLYYNSDISICNFERVYSENVIIDEKKSRPLIFNRQEAMSQLTRELYQQFVIAPCKIYKKWIFDDSRFLEGKIHEDEFMANDIYKKAHSVVYQDIIKMYYFQRSDSIMNIGFNLEARLNAAEALEIRKEMFESCNLSEDVIRTNRMLFNVYREIVHSGLQNEKVTKIEYKMKNIRKFLIQDPSLVHRLTYKSYYAIPKIMNNLLTLKSK